MSRAGRSSSRSPTCTPRRSNAEAAASPPSRSHAISTFEPGQRIGGLVIGDLLGRGAMGEVYRAEQVSLKRPVAVKRIATNLVDDDEIRRRFEREAQCIAKVQHPNVLSVYEFGTYADERGEPHTLMVMELVTGGCSLRDVERERADWRLVSGVIMQVADGLAAAAEYGIVHRDIKPDNIMLSGKGEAKLADFGLAKASDSLGMTMSGSVLGTPYYMSPEACLGDPVGHAGDLYSLGATWYHCLAGRPLFESPTTMAILRAHVEEQPKPLREISAEVPPAITELVERCVAKRPEERPASAQELADALRELRFDGESLPRRVPELVPRSVSEPVSRSADTLVRPDEEDTAPTSVMAERRDADRPPPAPPADSFSLHPEPPPPPGSSEFSLRPEPSRASAPPATATKRSSLPAILVAGLAGLVFLGAAVGGGWWLLRGPADDDGGSGNRQADDNPDDGGDDPADPDGGDPDTNPGEDPGRETEPENGGDDGDNDAAVARCHAIEEHLAADRLEPAWRAFAELEPETAAPALRERLERLRGLLARRAGEDFAAGLRRVGERTRKHDYGAAVDVLLGLRTAAEICGRDEDRKRLIALLEKAGNARDAGDGP